MKAMINKPYPKVRVEKKSQKYANILSYLYASNEGELTAILQYTYENFFIENSEIHLILKQISIAEMKHLEILGQLITLLGELPLYGEKNAQKFIDWNGDFVYYDTDFPVMMDINIEKEKKAIQNYQMALHVIDDIYIQEMIKRILEDEYLHLEIFMKLKQNC